MRSTRPFVHGCLIFVSRCSIPFSRRRTSNMWVPGSCGAVGITGRESELNAVVGQNGANLVRHGFDQGDREGRRRCPAGLGDELDEGEFAGPANRHVEARLALGGADFGHTDMEIPDWVGLEFLVRLPVAHYLGQSADIMPLQAAIRLIGGELGLSMNTVAEIVKRDRGAKGREASAGCGFSPILRRASPVGRNVSSVAFRLEHMQDAPNHHPGIAARLFRQSLGKERSERHPRITRQPEQPSNAFPSLPKLVQRRTWHMKSIDCMSSHP